MKRIIILNTPEVPIFGTHLFHVKKLCEGFKWNGIDVIEINTLESLYSINLNDKDFVYSSNYINCMNEVMIVLRKALFKLQDIYYKYILYPKLKKI